MGRLTIGLLASAGVACLSLGVAWSAPPPAHPHVSAAVLVQRVFHLPNGALAGCDPALCSDASQDGSFTLPAGHTYRVVVTESFQYRTRGAGKFETSLHIDGSRYVIRPGTRPLLASAQSTSMTLMFTTRLRGGPQFSIGADVGNNDPKADETTWFIRASKVLIVLDARPMHT